MDDSDPAASIFTDPNQSEDEEEVVTLGEDEPTDKESSSAVVFGEDDAAKDGDRSSSRDLIAEDLESGVGIDRGSKKTQMASDSFDELLLGEENAGTGEGGSSAIHLDFVQDLDELESGESETDLVSFVEEESGEDAEVVEDVAEEEVSGDLFDMTSEEDAEALNDLLDDVKEDSADELETTLGEGEQVNEEVDDWLGETQGETEALEMDESETTFADEMIEEDESSAVDLGASPDALEGVSDLVEEEVWVDSKPERPADKGDLHGAAVFDGSEPDPKPVKRGGSRILWSFIGLILGGGVAVGLWTFGLQPPDKWRDAIPAEYPLAQHEAKKTSGGNGGGSGGGQPKQIPLTEEVSSIKQADLSKPLPPVSQNNQAQPKVKVARAQFDWERDLALNAGKPTDAVVQQSRTTFEEILNDPTADAKAKADALFWLGQIAERTGDVAKARGHYQQGKTQFQNDPRFEASLNRLDSASAPVPMAKINRAEALGMLMIALQLQPQPANEKEAGELFWKAMKLAQQKKYPEAIQAMKQASDLHKTRRFTRLRKSQNPMTDPTEEIFLRSRNCLMKYWQLQEQLSDKSYLTLADVFKELDAKTKLASDRMMMITTLQQMQKVDREQIATLTKNLATTTKNLETAHLTIKARDMTIKTTTEKLAMTTDNLMKSQAQVRTLTGEKNVLEGVVGNVHKQLREAKYLDPAGDSKQMISGLNKVIDVALTKDPKQRIMKSENEIVSLKSTLQERWEPAQMLSYWLSVFSDPSQTRLIPQAEADLKRAEKEKLTPLARAHSLAVQGLIARNQGKFDEARKLMGQCLAVEAPDATGWKKNVKEATTRITDPTAYYIPEIMRLREDRQFKEAIELTNQAFRVFGMTNGRLFALRSLIHFEQATSAGGELAEDNASLKSAVADADSAIANGAKDAGHFLKGQIAEVLGKNAEAITEYKNALANHPTQDKERARYELALARVLLKPQAKKVAMLPKPGRMPSVKELMVLILVGIDVPPLLDPQVKEAQERAQAILDRPDIDKTPLLKAEALMIKGLWNQALKTYMKGMKSKVDEQTWRGMKQLIENHPTLQRPDTKGIPSPFTGLKHYNKGIGYFFADRYRDAEREFLLAIKNHDQDARYFYFLGLSRYMLDPRKGLDDFDQGARLEANGRPGSVEVNNALERVQGRPRKVLNEIRERVR